MAACVSIDLHCKQGSDLSDSCRQALRTTTWPSKMDNGLCRGPESLQDCQLIVTLECKQSAFAQSALHNKPSYRMRCMTTPMAVARLRSSTARRRCDTGFATCAARCRACVLAGELLSEQY